MLLQQQGNNRENIYLVRIMKIEGYQEGILLVKCTCQPDKKDKGN